MKRFCLLVLALSVVLSSAVEAKAATKKRGISNYGYGYPSYHSNGWNDYGFNSHGFNYNFGGNNYFPLHYAAEIPVLASLEHGGPLIPHDYNFGPELSLPPSHQQIIGFQPQLPTGGVPKQNGYRTGFGLGAYGVQSNFGGQKYTSTSGSDDDQVPKVTVPVSGYKPAYPPFTQIPVSTPRTSFPTAIVSKPVQVAQVAPQQPAVTLGSGGLGVVRLRNGNYALGSGSIGYGGSAPIVGAQQSNQRQIAPVFSAQPPGGNNFGGAYF